ncbi:hypothetical protein UB31_00430 [Bradyrhizobium sp. LTSP849]|nr:hypothetical protein UB31_00430 [Bradyrhizobium sp. LTSP849]
MALGGLKPSDWERFERLASTFLASEWPKIRTMASAGGDGGRDSELFCADGVSNVVIQYSVQYDWAAKVHATVTRLQETFPDATLLVYVSNQLIGAKADALRTELSKKGIYLDIRDKSWFVERCNLDQSRSAAASELARVIVDPLLEASGVKHNAASALSGQDARTAHHFLEMQWRDENASKGLTKSSFEALVRSALQGSDNEKRVSRDEVHARVGRVLPQHSREQLYPYVEAALKRLTKLAIRHWPKDDTFNLSFEETERLKDRKASVALLVEAFDGDLDELLQAHSELNVAKRSEVVELLHRIIEHYFLRQGEKFASALAHDEDFSLNDEDIGLVVKELSPKGKLVTGRDNVQFLLHIITTLMASPSEQTKEYLRLLADTYTLFAFLEEVPDVQKVTKKLFNHGQFWLDTSVLLPLFAEQALPESLRPFTALFKQAHASAITLRVTPGILEEIERHLNLCVTYTRESVWKGRVPYVVARYLFAGKPLNGFVSWVEQFRGNHQPIQDIADYLGDEFGVELDDPIVSEALDEQVVAAVREYWKKIHQDRRGGLEAPFSINANRLAEHDSENFISVLSDRRMQAGKSPLGYTTWLLTLDSAARRMLQGLEWEIREKIKHLPIISVDFLLKYLAFGPSRDRVAQTADRMPYVFIDPVMEVPKELLEVAAATRNESQNLPERIVQRRIRDALDRERMKLGPVQIAGLDGSSDAIESMF